MKTYYPAQPELFFTLPNFSNLMDAVKECNLPDEYKFAVLAKMANYESYQDISNLHIKETVLRELTEQARPMRVMDFVREENNGTLSGFCSQKVSAHLRQLVGAGLVRRTEKKTGKMFEIEPGKFVEESVAYFEIVT